MEVELESESEESSDLVWIDMMEAETEASLLWYEIQNNDERPKCFPF